MMLRHIFTFLFCLLGLSGLAQEYQSLLLPQELKADANAIIRSENISVEIQSKDKMLIRTERVVTVLNKYGQSSARMGEVYDEMRKIKDQEVSIYDRMGNRIQRVKQKDFLDQSLIGSNLFTDNRVSFFDFTPQEYPYTIVYTSEVESNSTVFVQSWNPVPGNYQSVQTSSYSLINNTGIPIRFKEKNFQGLEVEKSVSEYELEYKLTNLPAYKKEILSPDFDQIAPEVKVALKKFSLVGVEGTALNWNEFGKWQYKNLLQGKTELPMETKEKITALTASAKDTIEKIRRIYNYVQENTRYISVQLGIGGWEPMTAMEVDQLGYGDCKALTNYTRAILESQGIPSYYTVVYGSEEKVDLDSEFASMQGNHVILNIPNGTEDIWLECTSQTTPFNYLGDFTDDRNVLVVRPDGGEIVKTKAYSPSENLQESIVVVRLNDSGDFEAEFERTSRGVPYGNIYHLERETQKNKDLYYKNSWGHLRNLKLQSIELHNDKREIKFTEKLLFSGEKYASKAGNRFLLPLHFFKSPTYGLPNDKDRRFPLKVERGRTFKESFEYLLPEGFQTESVPEDVELVLPYGTYRSMVEVGEKDGIKSIVLKREYLINDGSWPSEEYSGYRDFMNKIASLGNQKAVIVKANL